MKMVKNIFGLVLFALVALGSCKEDIDEFIPDGPLTPPVLGKMIMHDFAGEITNEAGQPLEGVLVKAGNKSTLTDENGLFVIRQAEVNDDHALVKAELSGYFPGSRTLVVKEGNLSYLSIQMLEKAIAGTISASSGGSVNFEGVELNFPGEGIMVKSNGSNYTGNLTVYANYLDPSDEQIYQQMPGDLRGINLSNQEQVLATYGMMAVELVGENGEALQVKEGKSVEMRMPVPASMMASAPSSIPLWYFDEADGFWKEEGTASLDGNFYVGQVNHFSFWNCDAPFPLVVVRGTVTDPNGVPLPNVWLVVTTTGSGTRAGKTDDTGTFSGKMPKNQVLTFEVRDDCGNAVYSENFGPFSTDVTLPTIIVDPTTLTATAMININGRLVDCDDNPVVNGYIRVYYNATRAFSGFVNENDGTFELSSLVCDLSGNIHVVGYDLDNSKQTMVNTALGTNNMDLGDIRACDDFDAYITYNLDGTSTTIPDPFGGPDGNFTFINAYLDSLVEIYFAVEAVNQIGTYQLASSAGTNNFLFVNGISAIANVDVLVTFTAYGLNSGEYIEGTISGTFDGTDQMNHTLTGAFRIKRR